MFAICCAFFELKIRSLKASDGAAIKNFDRSSTFTFVKSLLYESLIRITAVLRKRRSIKKKNYSETENATVKNETNKNYYF